jgi:trans-2,3-dihydro-3-hydroxyanthranilate isomerase
MRYQFHTVDVFAEHRFGGNPLAVFIDAQGLTVSQMQALAMEMNLSETTFVFPAEDPNCRARVRIFNRTQEMPFAGHPMIGTAFVLARLGHLKGGHATFEIPAGPTEVTIELDASGQPHGALVAAPQPLSLGMTISPATVAECLGLRPSDIRTSAHEPVVGSVGNTYVIAELCDGALARCAPNPSAFRAATLERPGLGGRFSVHAYVRNSDQINARMFAPLAGTWEDPATGSANAPLAGLLLSLDGGDRADFIIHQGFEMGRPSLLKATAWKDKGDIRASVAGKCIPVFAGEVEL